MRTMRSAGAAGADRGWSWVVLCGCFFAQSVTIGILLSVGVYYVAFLTSIPGISKAEAAWPASILGGTMFILGPVSSAVVNRYGCRVSMIAGGLVSTAGFCLSSLSSTTLQLCMTYGFLVGLGECLVYIPSIVVLNDYFSRYRKLATSVAMSGAGTGAFIFPPLLQYFMDTYNLSGALLLNGGLSLQLLICGALMFAQTAPDPQTTTHRNYLQSNIDQNSPVIRTSGNCSIKDVDESKYTLVVTTPEESRQKLVKDNQCSKYQNKLSNSECHGRTLGLQLAMSSVGMIKRHSPSLSGVGVMVTRMQEVVRNELGMVRQSRVMKFMMVTLFSMTGVTTYFTYMCELAVTAAPGLPSEDIAVLVSIVGVSSLVGRLLAGLPLTHHHLQLTNSLMFALACLATAFFALLYTFMSTFIGFAAMAGGYGLAYGLYNVLYALAASDVLGSERMCKVLGYGTFTSGVGSLLGPPAAGVICDYFDGDLRIPFYLSFALLTLAFIFAVWLAQDKDNSDEKDKQPE